MSSPSETIAHPQKALFLAAVACAALIGYASINYVTGDRPGPDAGTYAGAALMVAEGRVLYREVLSLAPGPAVIGAIALTLGDGTYNAIRAAEKTFAAAGSVIAFLLAMVVTRRLVFALLGAALYAFILSAPPLLEGGNLTEEYGALFAVAAVFAGLRWRRHEGAAASGVCFALAAMCKEPLALAAVGWLPLILSFEATWPGRVRRFVAFSAGVGSVVGVFLAYLLATGSLVHWLDRLQIAAQYVSETGGSHMAFAQKHRFVAPFFVATLYACNRSLVVFSCVGLIATIAATVRRGELPFEPRIAAGAVVAFAFEYLAAATSGRIYGHYCLQMIPSLLVLSLLGAGVVARLAESVVGRRQWIASAAVGVFVLLDTDSAVAFARRLGAPFATTPIGDVSRAVRNAKLPNDMLWAPWMFNSRYYVETGLTPTTMLHFVDVAGIRDSRLNTADGKVAKLMSELDGRPPEWIILGDKRADLQRLGILAWVCRHYVRTVFADAAHGYWGFLYVRDDHAPVVRLPRRDDPICADVLLEESSGEAKANRLTAALLDAERAARAQPDNKRAFAQICAVDALMQLPRAAVEACDRALAIDPHDELARRWRDALLQPKGAPP